MSTLAKDVTRIDRAKLIRLFVKNQPDPTKHAPWIELGHFLAGFDFKLERVREIDGSKRENAIGYESQGTFEAAQNAIVDFQNHVNLLVGPLSLAMLYGQQLWPTQGKLLVLDWSPLADKTYEDRRVSIVADPAYNAQLMTSGTITGFVTGFELYRISNFAISPGNGNLSFTTLETLNPATAISVSGTGGGA